MSVRSLATLADPNSMNKLLMDEHPGPPFNQRITESYCGSRRDSKNLGHQDVSRYSTIKQVSIKDHIRKKGAGHSCYCLDSHCIA